MNIPGYRIERRIGHGGMACVYLAIQESLERPVALKVLNEGFASEPKHSKSFLDEGRIIASLNHKNIVTIYDVGVADDRHYISMEYVEGGDLVERMHEGVPPGQAFELIRAMGECLERAHRANVVHRDVKPANILFRVDGTPLLTDFGIAKRLSGDATVTRSVFGTPGYLSPEQAQGHRVDGRSDIYSLGVILYEMLVGKKPYEADTEIATILKQLQDPIPALPTRLAGYQPLLDRMIARSPDDRFADVGKMIAHIDRAVAGGAKAGRGTDRRVRSGLAVGAVAAGCAAIAAAVFLADGPAVLTTATTRPVAMQEPPRQAPVPALPAPEPVTPEQEAASAAERQQREAVAGLVRQAQEAIAERDFAAARAHVAEGLLLKPGDPQLLLLAQRADTGMRVEELLASAEEAIADYRLTTPAGDNALQYFEKARALEPENEVAKNGTARIAQRYAELAEDRIARYKYAEAREFIRRGLEIHPGDRYLAGLRERAQLKNAPRQALRDLKSLFD